MPCNRKGVIFLSKNTDFEKAIEELEKIVSQLEGGEVSLDESIKLFERGMELTGICRKTLDTARQKIVTLTEAEEEAENGGK